MIDIEEILKKKREQDAAAKKPRFIPKRERLRQEAEAKAKAELEIQRVEQERKDRARSREAKWLAGADGSKNGSKNSSKNGTDNRHSQISPPTGPRGMTQTEDRFERGDRGRWGGRDSGAVKRSAEEMEQDEIRARYMGPDLSRSSFTAKKQKRQQEKFRFDWDPSEDTSRAQSDAVEVDPRSRHPGQFPDLHSVDYERKLEAHTRYLEEMDRVNGKRRAEALRTAYEKHSAKVYKKDKHWTAKTRDEMTARDWRILKGNFGITTTNNVAEPLLSWNDAGLGRELQDVIYSLDWHEPSPIQRAAIPIVQEGQDLLAEAPTGSGKTGAFLIPLVDRIRTLPPIVKANQDDGPYALIMSPTRELAQQIMTEAAKLCEPFGFRVVDLIGGHDLNEQLFALRDGAHIIVATPGRLVECLEHRVIVLSQCRFFIMDEADRMLDAGLEDQLTKIVESLPGARDQETAVEHHYGAPTVSRPRRMLFSATMPQKVEKLAKDFLKSPARVKIGITGEAVHTVVQKVEFVKHENERKKRLLQHLGSGEFQKPIIVFVNTKHNCEAVAKELKTEGFSVASLHGNKGQEQRDAAMKSLRTGRVDILVATDVAGRGIDVPAVSLVINYNMTSNIEAYTHRIGRTGRAGKTGYAITFIGQEDEAVLYDLNQMISKSPLSKVPDELKFHPAARTKPAGGKLRDIV